MDTQIGYEQLQYAVWTVSYSIRFHPDMHKIRFGLTVWTRLKFIRGIIGAIKKNPKEVFHRGAIEEPFWVPQKQTKTFWEQFFVSVKNFFLYEEHFVEWKFAMLLKCLHETNANFILRVNESVFLILHTENIKDAFINLKYFFNN